MDPDRIPFPITLNDLISERLVDIAVEFPAMVGISLALRMIWYL